MWYFPDATQLKLAPNLRCPYEGPYVIVKKINDLDYVIQFDEKGKKKLVHHNEMKPNHGDVIIKWVKRLLNKITVRNDVWVYPNVRGCNDGRFNVR